MFKRMRGGQRIPQAEETLICKVTEREEGLLILKNFKKAHNQLVQ